MIVSIDSLGYSKELQNVKTTNADGEPIPQGEVFADSFYEFMVDTSTTPARLVGKQYLWYTFHLNPAGELTTTWEWKNGKLVVEKVFQVPGIGRYFYLSIQNRDYPLIMGTTCLLALLLIIFTILSDLMYKVVNPRVDFD